MKTLKQLRDEYAQKKAALDAIKAKGDDDLTDADIDAGNVLPGEMKALQDEIERFEAARRGVNEAADAAKAFAEQPARRPNYSTKADAEARNQAAEEEAATKATGRVDPGTAEAEKFLRTGGFKSAGHFFYSIKRAGTERPGFVEEGALGLWNRGVGRHDDFVKGLGADVKAATGMNELADSEGGALVPIDFAAGIWARTQGEENLLTRIGATPVTGNTLKIIAWNDATRTNNTLFGGAQAYWTAEATQGTNSKPTVRDIELRLDKLMVLLPATDELLADTPALEAELNRIAGACIVYKINQAIIRGTGGPTPKGLLNEQCRVTQATGTGQSSATIVAKNIDAMFKRRAPGSTQNLIWLYTIDAEDQLNQLSLPTGSSSGQLVNMPPTGLAGQPNATLKGRPMIEMEHCSALGTEGDVILWDPTSSVAIVKSTGINQAVSMHLRFDYDETVFRFTFRMDVRSRWDAALTPAVSTNTRSPIVTLSSTRN